MAFIKVWCEYDFSGNFGANNDQDVFEIEDDLSQDYIEDLVFDLLSGHTGLDNEDLSGCYDWEYISVSKLGE